MAPQIPVSGLYLTKTEFLS